MTVAITATVLTVGSSLYNAKKGRDATRDSTNAILSAEEQSVEEQRRQYDQTRADFAPVRELGNEAIGNLRDPNAFEASPGYQFRVNEGNRNTENLFSVKGGGGNAMRALTEYNQNAASNEFGQWFNRETTKAGLGTSGSLATAQAGANAANNISNSRWRSGENQAGLSLYGAKEQAGYTNQALADLLGGVKGIYDKRKPKQPGVGGI